MAPNNRLHIAILLFGMAAFAAACTHDPLVSPGETIRLDAGEGRPEPMDTSDLSAARSELDGYPIFVQNCAMSGFHHTRSANDDQVVGASCKVRSRDRLQYGSSAWNDPNTLAGNGPMAPAIPHRTRAVPPSPYRIDRIRSAGTDGTPND